MVDLLNQTQFSFKIELLSDLHIGTGESAKLSEITGKKRLDDKEDPDVSLIARDFNNDPTIPVTSLKGALRRCIDPQIVGELFGEVKDSDQGSIGTVWIQKVSWHTSKIQTDDLPYWKADRNTWISSHFAKNRKYGVADDEKLFFVERLPKAAKFQISGIAFGKNAIEHIKTVLSPLANANGMQLGAGEKFGAGTVRLFDDVEVKQTSFDPRTSEIEEKPAEKFQIEFEGVVAKAQLKHLILKCQGPYLSADTSPPPIDANANVRRAAKRNTKPLLQPTRPLLQPTSLMGALRARAAWLCYEKDIGTGELRDNYNKEGHEWLNDSKEPDPSKLQPCELLFGVSGFKGLIQIVYLECIAGKIGDSAYTGIAIDRFSQATIDGALFKTEYFLNSEFEVKLALNYRSLDNSILEPVRSLYEILIKDIKENGIELGLMTHSGFGWFLGAEVK